MNQEFNINGLEESSSKVVTIDSEDYNSDSSEDSSNDEEESSVNDNAINNAAKDRCNEYDKFKKSNNKTRIVPPSKKEITKPLIMKRMLKKKI